jgi:hypothetical protein
MKHLIIFLGYNQSRLDNPVYRRFTSSPFYPKEVLLLYLSGRLDDRELLHQVSELQKKEATPTDITFHLCTSLTSATDAETLLQAVRIVRRQPRLQPTPEATYPLFVYALLPSLDRLKPTAKQTLWRNLGQLNQAALRYHDCPWTQCIFLYHDETQRSLADFLYETISARLTVRDLLPEAAETSAEGAEGEARGMFAPVFGSFNSFGIAYPEQEVRAYLRMGHLEYVLQCADSAYNETSTADCIRLAEELYAQLPTDLVGLALDAENGGDAPSPAATEGKTDSRTRLKQRLSQALEAEADDLKDQSREEWAKRMATFVDNYYESRFLPGGVAYFFAGQERETSRYSEALSRELSQAFAEACCRHCLPADALRPVVRALVNRLQQRALELRALLDEEERNVAAGDHYIHQLRTAWESATLLSRLTGRDRKIRDRYLVGLTQLYLSKTYVYGYRFALALLDEVIVHVSALDERCAAVQETLTEALASLRTALEESSPAPMMGIFDSSMLPDARERMRQDQDLHLSHYGRALTWLFGRKPATEGHRDSLQEGYELLTYLGAALEAETDRYLDESIRSGHLPLLLGFPIADRLQYLYASEGGYDRFIRVAKERAALTLKLKASSAPTEGQKKDRYLLLSAKEPQESVDRILQTTDTSRVELLHLLSGLSLNQLDGFAGYRLAFEPAMF